MKALSAIHARLQEHIAFGWEIYDEHWQSHFVAVFSFKRTTGYIEPASFIIVWAIILISLTNAARRRFRRGYSNELYGVCGSCFY